MSGVRETAATARAGSHKAPFFQNKLKFSRDWITRPLFGVLLAAIAIAATWYGGPWFVAFLVVGCGAAAREWHRMFARREFWLPAVITIAAIAASLITCLFWNQNANQLLRLAPYLVLWSGAIAQLPVAALRGESALAHAGGVLYVGIPALAFLLLRLSAPHAITVVLMLLLAIWATDTGALVTGTLIGGPKLAPSWSPNKTWAGFVGGLCIAGAVTAGVALTLRSQVLVALAFGLAISVAAQAGDLFESVVKRRSGRKNSGGLIPGHGGVLDRIDSSLFAAPLAAILILGFGFDPLPGVTG